MFEHIIDVPPLVRVQASNLSHAAQMRKITSALWLKAEKSIETKWLPQDSEEALQWKTPGDVIERTTALHVSYTDRV